MYMSVKLMAENEEWLTGGCQTHFFGLRGEISIGGPGCPM